MTTPCPCSPVPSPAWASAPFPTFDASQESDNGPLGWNRRSGQSWRRRGDGLWPPHLSALLWGNWKGSLWLPLPSREPGTAGRQCHQLASLQVSPPPPTHTQPSLAQKHPSQKTAPLSSPISHHSITPTPSALVYTVCSVMIICAGLCVSLQVFLRPLCVDERGLWFVCVCVCPCMRSRALCVCVSAPDQTLIAIFSPTEVGGSHPAPCGEGRVWILGDEGKSRER